MWGGVTYYILDESPLPTSNLGENMGTKKRTFALMSLILSIWPFSPQTKNFAGACHVRKRAHGGV